MTRLNPAFTSRKALNITYQAPQETLLSTPETLPTSEPDTPQISYTVAQADLPTFNIPPYQKKWVAYLIGAGKAVTAATVYWRMKKNGASVNTGSSSVSANYYYTVNAFFYDVAVGDVLELALWSNQTDSNWDYKAYHIQVSRVILIDKPRLLSPCYFAALAVHPNIGLGTPNYSYGNYYPVHCDQRLPATNTTLSIPFLYPQNTYGIFQLGYGDYSYSNGASVRTSATYRPYYYRNYVLTQIIMRGVRID
jgi:hypothetical protein